MCKLKKGNHLMNESSSNKKLNYSFKSINYSHSKPRKIKSISNIKSYLFNYFSSEHESKQKIDYIKLREEKEKKTYHNNKIFERIMLKTRNNKTINIQKNNLRATIIKNEKEKIIENENEDEKDTKKNEKKKYY